MELAHSYGVIRNGKSGGIYLRCRRSRGAKAEGADEENPKN